MAKKKPTVEPQPEIPPLRLEWRSPSELAENPHNWRSHPTQQISALTDVIADVGWAGACLFNELTGRLIDGHARKKVALDQGATKIPVLIGSWTEAQEKTILATLDPLAALAEADTAKLDALLREVQTGSEAVASMLTDLAKSAGVIPSLATGAGGDEFDATPEETGPTRCQVGDLWLIRGGALEHRLLVGDCTVRENVDRLMGGEKVGLCFTSPPYAQQRDYGQKITDWDALMQGSFGCLPMTQEGQVLVNLGLIHREGEWVPYWDGWIEWMRGQGWRRFGWYVWDQLSGFPGVFGGRCAPSFEFIFHFNKATTVAEKHIPTKLPGRQKAGGSMGKNGWVEDPSRTITIGEEKIPDATWRIGNCGGKTEISHSAQFPVALPDMAIKTWPADVYDPFLGSGTTLIAGHRLGRKVYGCEIEPRYGDVILKRAEAEGLMCEKAPSNNGS